MNGKRKDTGTTAGLDTILPVGLRALLSAFLIAVIVGCGLAIGFHIADPQSASPKELGIPTFLLFAIGALCLVVTPWSRLGARIRKTGVLEFEEIVLSQKRQQAELLDSLSRRVEKLEAAGRPAPTATVTREQKELHDLLPRFLAKFPKTERTSLGGRPSQCGFLSIGGIGVNT